MKKFTKKIKNKTLFNNLILVNISITERPAHLHFIKDSYEGPTETEENIRIKQEGCFGFH